MFVTKVEGHERDLKGHDVKMTLVRVQGQEKKVSKKHKLSSAVWGIRFGACISTSTFRRRQSSKGMLAWPLPAPPINAPD